MSNALYRGYIDDERDFVIVKSNGDALDMRNDLANHSPDGGSWGYAGSGPAQLSLGILCDYLKDDLAALRLYQEFKFAVVTRLDKDSGWTLTKDEIEAALHPIRQRFNKHYRVHNEDGVAVACTPGETASGELLWEGDALSYEHALFLASKQNPSIDYKTGVIQE